MEKLSMLIRLEVWIEALGVETQSSHNVTGLGSFRSNAIRLRQNVLEMYGFSQA